MHELTRGCRAVGETLAPLPPPTIPIKGPNTCPQMLNLNPTPQINPQPLAQSGAALKRVQSAREEECSRGGGGGGEVSLAREVMRPHRHKDDKDTSGWLSSFKSH